MSTRLRILWAIPLGYLLTSSAYPQTSTYPQVAVAGSFNDWNSGTPNMTLVANNTWQGDFTIANKSFEFKFATPGFGMDWGHNNQPYVQLPLSATASIRGSDIRVTNGTDNTQFRFIMNTSTREYTVFLLNNSDTNLLFNAGFETQGSIAKRARHWQQTVPNLHGHFAGSAERQDWGVAHGGTWMGMILGTWANLGNSGSFWQEASVEPSVTYEASAWFLSEGPPNAWTAGVQQLRLEYYDFNKTNLLAAYTRDLQDVPTNWAWRNVSGAAPEGAAWGRLVLNVAQAGASGTFRMDDTELYATSARRTEDFNAWGPRDTDDCYNRAGWLVCTGQTVSSIVYEDQEIQLARSGFAASLNNPGAQTNGSFIQSPQFQSGIGTISFWYRHGHYIPEEEPDEPVNLAVQVSSAGESWVTVAELNNIYSTTYRRFSVFQERTVPYYVRIVHAGGSANRLLVDDIEIDEPVAAPRLMDFDGWPDSGTNAGCHLYAGWQVCTGRVAATFAKAGKAAQILGDTNSSSYLLSPFFADGYATISFSYRRGLVGFYTAGLRIEASSNGVNWITLDTVTNISALTWQDYSRDFMQPTPQYVRIRNLFQTNVLENASAFLDEPFDGGSVPPEGWTFVKIGQYTSTDSSGRNPPSLSFNQDGSYIITPTIINPTNATFMTKGNSISAESSLSVSGLVAGSWVNLTNMVNLTNTKITRSLRLTNTITQLMFTYTKVAGNLAFDDLIVSGIGETGAVAQTLLLEDVNIAAPVEVRKQDFNTWPVKTGFLTGTTQHQNWVVGGQSKVATNKAYQGQTLQLSRASESSDYYVDFEGSTETKGTYPSNTVRLSGLDWNLTEVLIGTLSNDWKNGVRAARLRANNEPSMSMLTNKAGGLGTLSFKYRRYGTDAQTNWVAQYSTNNGSTWAQIGSPFLGSADVQTFSQAVNVPGDVRVRIKRWTTTSVTDRRLNIDDILLTGYGGGPGSDAYVQSHYFPGGIGPVSFQYRHWMDSTPPAGSILQARIQTSSNGVNWTTQDTLMISNTSYRLHETYINETNHYYGRILIDQGSGIALLDDIFFDEPKPPATLTMSGSVDPQVPFTNDYATLRAAVFAQNGAHSIAVTSYYRIGTSGAWTALGMTADGSDYTATNPIAPQPTGTVVQYYMKATFLGPGASLSSPVYYPTNWSVEPAWYGIPRNPPGRVWINEIDYDNYDWTISYEFVELAGLAGTDLSGWKIELRDSQTSAFRLFGEYVIPPGAVLSDTLGGYGFYVLGAEGLMAPPRDMLMTNSLGEHIPGAVRLVNEMNGVEAAMAYGGTTPSYYRIPPDDYEEYDPYEYGTNAIALVGVGAVYEHFAWTNREPTPGAVNPGQTFADPAVIAASPTSLVFQYIRLSYSPAGQTLVISNAGVSALSYALTTNAPWLSVQPTEGAEIAPSSVVAHTVSVNTDGLTGNRSGQIVISGNAGNSPVTVPVQLNEVNLDTALLFYPFNESIGAFALNQGSAGASGNMELLGGLTRTLEGGGVSGRAGDYALISEPATNWARTAGAVTNLNNRSQFTVTGWMRTTATGGIHRLFGNRAATNGFVLMTSSNYQNIALVSSATGSPAAVTSTNGALADGAWQFFAVTFDAANPGADAVQFFGGTKSSGVYRLSSHALGGLGPTGLSTGQVAAAGNGVNSFQGRLDDVRFYAGVQSLMSLEAVRRAGAEGGGEEVVPPTITQQPQSATQNYFTALSVGVTASGTPDPVYQWRKDGVALPGQNNNSISFDPLLLDDAGVYSVVVSNVGGWVVSSNATILVLAPPAIADHPVSLVVYAGETATLSVNATGTPPMKYQWTWQNSPMSGETNPLLILYNVQTNQAGTYSVRITNRVAFSNSALAGLTVRTLNLAEGGHLRKAPTGGGTVLRFPTISNRWYEVWWSSNLALGVEGFVPLTTNLPSVPGTNFIWFTDAVYGVEGRGFYHLRSRTNQ